MQAIADTIREQAGRRIAAARRAGQREVTIVAGEIVRELGLVNRVPAVCSALGSRKFMALCHVTLERTEGPPSGLSTTTRFVYRLDETAGDSNDVLLILRGSGRTTFESLGGGEAFLQGERAEFGG